MNCGCVDYSGFEAWQGSELQLEWEGRVSENGQPFDLTGATATCVLKNRPEDPEAAAVIKLTTENGGILNTQPSAGKLLAVFTGEATAGLPAYTCGHPQRDYWSQFAVRLATDQLVRSAVYKVTLFAGAAVNPVDVP